MASLECGLGRGKFLPVNTAIEYVHANRVVREYGQTGDEIADLVVRINQRGRAQVLLVRGLQDVVRDIAGLGHAEIAMVHGLRNNYCHQAVFVGDLLGVAWL